MYRKFIAVVFAAFITATAGVCAHAYTYPYNTDTYVFDVPYTTVTREELQEPENVVGEVRETDIDSGEVTLQFENGNVLRVTPFYYSYYNVGGSRGYNVYNTNGGKWTLSDSEGNELANFKIDQDKDSQMFPIFYKSRLLSGYTNYFYTSYYTYELSQDTLEASDTAANDAQTFSPCELDSNVIFERKDVRRLGVVELTQGSFISGQNFNYYYNSNGHKGRYFSFTSDGHFLYSRDGIYYMRVSCPVTARKFAHYSVNGINSIILKLESDDGDGYIAYSIDDLNKCWDEYCGESPYVYLDNIKMGFEYAPVIIDGVTYMPLRFLLETANAEVNWDETTSSAEIKYYDKTVVIQNSNDTATVNNKEIKIDASAQIINGKMIIPLRFISESLGWTVDWEQDTKTVYISIPKDRIYRYFDIYPQCEDVTYNVVLNGTNVDGIAVNSSGQTLLPAGLLDNWFYTKTKIREDEDLTRCLIYKEDPVEIAWKSILEFPDFEYTSWIYQTIKYNPSADGSGLFRGADNYLKYKDILLPIYKFVLSTDRQGNIRHHFFSVEESADMVDFIHFEWIEEENTMYIYILDDMVKYDDALKAILDKKGIKYDTDYSGEYFKDIDAMQTYSENDLSKLVRAGINSGIISEEDYSDGRLRPTRTISHLDLERMLTGIGEKYAYASDEKNKPVTQEEFQKMIESL